MRYETPQVDETHFEQLVEIAKSFIRMRCPDWTDLSPSDPGMVLVELFAHMTELMLYKLNQLPRTASIEFLRLIGTRLIPPTAASVELEFSLDAPRSTETKIPLGTEVSASRSDHGHEPPVFVTSRAAIIEAGQLSVTVLAHHCTYHAAELVKLDVGGKFPVATVAHSPIVAPIDDADVIVAVSSQESAESPAGSTVVYQDRHFASWREVDDFRYTSAGDNVFVLDRQAGRITFASPFFSRYQGAAGLQASAHAPGNIPRTDSEVRVWYRSGGGSAGNVTAGTLTVLKDGIQGVTVRNPKPAVGGRDAETLDNALLRGPHEFFSMQRAVTAQDYETIAVSVGGVARARANTKAARWKFARPGTVDLLITPWIGRADSDSDSALTREEIESLQAEEARLAVERKIKSRQVLGTSCQVQWVPYKSVSVSARVVAHPGEDIESARQGVLAQLNKFISPAITKSRPGWQFGEPLRLSAVYDCVSANGRRQVDQIRLRVDDGAPNADVEAICVDPFHKGLLFASSRNVMFRSSNSGTGWEPIHAFDPAAKISLIAAHPEVPGLIAVGLTHPSDGTSAVDRSSIWMTADCGSTWNLAHAHDSLVYDLAWVPDNNERILLLATDRGLYEMTLGIQAAITPIDVDGRMDTGFFSVTATRITGGQPQVAVGGVGKLGVFLSRQGGKSGSFERIGLETGDVRVLTTHLDQGKLYLWAGFTKSGHSKEKGCAKIQLLVDAKEWQFFDKGWVGESCNAIAFDGTTILAATHSGGVVSNDLNQPDREWERLELRTGALPIRGEGERLFIPVKSLAVDPAQQLHLAGGKEGLYVRTRGGLFQSGCRTEYSEFSDLIPLPNDMLFCSGKHEITVVTNNEES